MDSSTEPQVVVATSNDDRHPPNCILDRNPNTYWATTGLYPQEVIVTLPSSTTLSSVTVKTSNVRKLSLERSDATEPGDFKPIIEKELEFKEGHFQVEEFKLKNPLETRHLKLILQQGYAHFSTVHSVVISGT